MTDLWRQRRRVMNFSALPQWRGEGYHGRNQDLRLMSLTYTWTKSKRHIVTLFFQTECPVPVCVPNQRMSLHKGKWRDFSEACESCRHYKLLSWLWWSLLHWSLFIAEVRLIRLVNTAIFIGCKSVFSLFVFCSWFWRWYLWFVQMVSV